MIIVTGAAGFIGSNMVSKLNSEGFKDIVVVDDFSHPDKNKNLEGKIYSHKVHRSDLMECIDANHRLIQFIFHMGARSATTGFPKEVYDELNLDYTKANLIIVHLGGGISVAAHEKGRQIDANNASSI